MRHILVGIFLLLTTSLMSQTAVPKPAVSAQARQIHESALVIDTHADTPQRFVDENFDLAADAGQGHIDLKKIRAGNLGAEFFSIWVEPKWKGQFAHRALDLIDSVYAQAARHPDQVTMAFTADDIVRAHQQHKFAALMGIEGGHAIEDDIHILRNFYRLGVRYMTLTWSNTNEWADAEGDVNKPDVPHHNGLTEHGREIVGEMNRLGMMVDISHVADKTFWDTLAVAKAPVIASHSAARALTNATRNMTDDMLQAVAKNGGVVNVNFYSAFIDETYRVANNAQAAERDAAVKAAEDEWKSQHPGLEVPGDIAEAVQRQWGAKLPRPPLKSLIDHIDHIAKVAGIDHVGLGSDFDGVSGQTPQGIDSAADLPRITQGLLDRGYTAAQIHKVLGGNLLRVFREVERVSRELRGASPEWEPHVIPSAARPPGTGAK